MKESLTNLIDFFGLAWWVEITTSVPQCTYYFGPFLTQEEAEASKDGYIEDLEGEGAEGIGVEVKRCKPKELTVCDYLGKIEGPQAWPALAVGSSYPGSPGLTKQKHIACAR